MLLCVNTRIRLIGLANVDVTDVSDEEEIFKRLQMVYQELRGKRRCSPLIKPKTMQYIKVKFKLSALSKLYICYGIIDLY